VTDAGVLTAAYEGICNATDVLKARRMWERAFLSS